MTKKIRYLTIVGNTAYFFCKKINYLLPIPVTAKCIENIIKSTDFAIPHIHNTFIRTLNAFDTKIERIIIYGDISDILLAYIRIQRNDKTLDINSTFEDCLVFATHGDIDIEVDEKILLEKGFFVSKEMVEKALTYNEVT